MRAPISGLAVVLVATATAQAQSAIEKYELDNGLTVILRSTDGAGSVACVTLFDIGDEHDPPDRSGLGHFVEHVYVTAEAGETPASTADAWMMRYDRQCNAQTGRDYTVVATVFPPADLEAELAEAAARMGYLRVLEKDVARERPRMIQELANMHGGIPTLAVTNVAGDRAAPLPNGGRKGGRIEQVERVTLDEIVAHHRDYYKPSNATLVLVGGFDTTKARRLIEEHYGGLPPGEPVTAPGPAPAPRPELVSIASERPPFGEWPQRIATIGFRAPAPDNADFAPYLILTGRVFRASQPAILEARRTGSLVMPIMFVPLDRPELVFFSSEVADDQTDEQAIAALRGRVRGQMKLDEPPNPILLYQSFGAFLGLMELPAMSVATNPYGVAFSMGRLHQRGIDPTVLRRQVEAVTVEDLNRCADTVFGVEQGAEVVVRVE